MMTSEHDDKREERTLYQKLSSVLDILPTDAFDARQAIFEVLDHLDAESSQAAFPAGVDVASQLRLVVIESGRRMEIPAASGLKPAVINLFMDGKAGLSIEWAEKLAAAVGYRLTLVRRE